MFVSKRNEGAGESCVMKRFVICTHQLIFQITYGIECKNLSAIGPNLSEGNPVHKSSSLQSVLSRINPALITVSAKARCRSYSVPDEPSLIYNLTLSVLSHSRVGVPRTVTRWQLISLGFYGTPPDGSRRQYIEYSLTEARITRSGHNWWMSP